MRNAVLILLCYWAPIHAIGQNEIEALRYSMITPSGGSARFMATGGAFGAIGADISCLHYNPAGMARYRYSEMTMSVGAISHEAQTFYLGNARENSTFRMNFNNFGFVGAIRTKGNEFSKWKRLTFGFSYSKTADFHENFLIAGRESPSSLLDVFVSQATGISEQNLQVEYPFTADLAYQTYAMDPNPLTGGYVHRFDGETVDQTKVVERTGRMSENAISFGGNYNDKIYLGASLGITGIRFREEGRYIENTNQSDSIVDMIEYRYDDELITNGTGINLKVGIIASPLDWLRLGLAAHTPTSNLISDRYAVDMLSYWWDGTSEGWSSPTGTFDYVLRTPGRLIGSVALIFRKYGLISLDYEYVDYSKARIRTPRFVQVSYNFSAENAAVQNVYDAVSNIRVGAEVRIKEKLALRAGLAMYGSPFRGSNTATRQIISGGLGYRWKIFFADLSVSNMLLDEQYYLYDPSRIPPAQLSLNRTQVNLSMGLRFR